MDLKNKIVKVIIDRPLGSVHPNYPNIVYPINYGYIEGVIAPDGEEQDAYVLGVDKPLERFEGRVIAVINRKNDVENKLIVAPINKRFTAQEILKQVEFQEKFFDVTVTLF